MVATSDTEHLAMHPDHKKNIPVLQHTVMWTSLPSHLSLFVSVSRPLYELLLLPLAFGDLPAIGASHALLCLHQTHTQSVIKEKTEGHPDTLERKEQLPFTDTKCDR